MASMHTPEQVAGATDEVRDEATDEATGAAEPDLDEVEEAGLESFPASDPPSSWAGHD